MVCCLFQTQHAFICPGEGSAASQVNQGAPAGVEDMHTWIVLDSGEVLDFTALAASLGELGY
jgi:hypothetical protein